MRKRFLLVDYSSTLAEVQFLDAVGYPEVGAAPLAQPGAVLETRAISSG